MIKDLSFANDVFHVVYHDDIELLTVCDFLNYNAPFLTLGITKDNKLQVTFRQHLLHQENYKLGFFLYGYFANEADLNIDSFMSK